MANETNGTSAQQPEGWMNDVQKTLAYFITFSFVVLIFVWVFRPPVMAAESMAQLNQLVSTLQNLLVMAFGFFLGSTMNSKSKDDSQNRIVEKLTSPPVVPVTTTVVAPWWNKLTDAERSAITTSTDPKVIDFVKAPVSIQPAPDDIALLVAKGLLTQDRATVIQAT
jgi:hypothetical protein